LGLADQKGSPVELLLLARLESCGRLGGDRWRLVTLIGWLQFVSEWHGNCPIVRGSVVPKGYDGRSLRMLGLELWQVMSVWVLALMQGGAWNGVDDGLVLEWLGLARDWVHCLVQIQ